MQAARGESKVQGSPLREQTLSLSPASPSSTHCSIHGTFQCLKGSLEADSIPPHQDARETLPGLFMPQPPVPAADDAQGWLPAPCHACGRGDSLVKQGTHSL